MEIIKIQIKSESGYGPVEESYKDKLVLTRESIAYEFVPYCESKCERIHKWNYKTNSLIFASLYSQICEVIPRYLDSDEILYCTDIGPTDLVVTYKDKSRKTEHFYCPSEFFRDLFILVRKMIPPCEDIPVSLILDDDEFEDLPFN